MVILPLRQTDGKIDTLVCYECAKKSEAYCRKHNRPHLGFIDGTTACRWCIEELVETYKNKASQIKNTICEALPEDQREDLSEASEISSEIMESSQNVAILRFVATSAMRSNRTIEDIVDVITESHSVDCILWK